MPHFLYRLKLTRPEAAQHPTPEEAAIVDEHFANYERLLAEGVLILAGRTLTDDPFGITIINVPDEAAARNIVENDPAVKKGVMTAELFPYRVALINEANAG